MGAGAAVNTRSSAPLRQLELQLRDVAIEVKIAKAGSRQVAESFPERTRLGLSRAFCIHVMETWWAQLRGRSRRALRAPWCDAPELTDEYALGAAQAVGELAARLSVEHAAYLIGTTYALMLPEAYRRKHGVFYTPPDVTRRLLDRVTTAGANWRTDTVLDPACGGGAFLGPVVARIIDASIGERSPSAIVDQIRQQVRGYELDPFAAWISQTFVDAVIWKKLGARAFRPLNLVEVCDSLTKVEAPPFDVVIGNPPYGRTRLTPGQRKLFERSLFGHANLYGLFLDLAVQWTRPKGVVAFVTPTSFLSGEYYKRLRSLLAADAPPVAIDFVAERQGVFDDVLQETALAVYRRGGVSGDVSIAFLSAGRGRLEATPAGSFELPDDREQPWVFPRRYDLRATARALEKMPHRLSDWGYRVSTGPLVWNRHKEKLRWRTSKTTVPLIWAEAVTPDGKFIFRATRRNHAPFFAVTPEDEWVLVREPCVLLQRTTAKEQPRRLIAAELPAAFLQEHGAVTVENHLNMLVPTTSTPSVPPKVVAAFLNSAAADSAFRCINGSVAVSAFELEAMPLPSPKDMTTVAEARGRRQVEAACAKLYS